MSKCRKCDVVLVRGENWTEGMAKYNNYLCQTCGNIKSRKFRKANAGHVAVYNREWRKVNAEAISKYRKENAEAIAKYQRKYAEDNAKHLAEYRRDYRNTPEGRAKKNAAEQAREARKLAQTPWMSAAEYAEVEAMYLYNAVMPGTWHVDHIQPISKGGLHHPSNLQLMRGEENVRKHARWDCCDQAKAAESAIQGKLSLLLDHAQRF